MSYLEILTFSPHLVGLALFDYSAQDNCYYHNPLNRLLADSMLWLALALGVSSEALLKAVGIVYLVIQLLN